MGYSISKGHGGARPSLKRRPSARERMKRAAQIEQQHDARGRVVEQMANRVDALEGRLQISHDHDGWELCNIALAWFRLVNIKPKHLREDAPEPPREGQAVN